MDADGEARRLHPAVTVRELVRREFTVDVPLQRAWDHLADVESWPSWARHIKRVTLDPPGRLTERSAGAFRLAASLGRVFGAIYARNLDKAIPNLQRELRATSA